MAVIGTFYAHCETEIIHAKVAREIFWRENADFTLVETDIANNPARMTPPASVVVCRVTYEDCMERQSLPAWFVAQHVYVPESFFEADLI